MIKLICQQTKAIIKNITNYFVVQMIYSITVLIFKYIFLMIEIFQDDVVATKVVTTLGVTNQKVATNTEIGLKK